MKTSTDYFYNILKKVVKESDLLSSQNTHKLIIIAIEDYLNKKIDLKSLSHVATQLYYEVNKPSDFNKNNYSQKLGNILSQISELEFYSTNKNKNENNKKMDEEILNNMNTYYKNK